MRADATYEQTVVRASAGGAGTDRADQHAQRCAEARVSAREHLAAPRVAAYLADCERFAPEGTRRQARALATHSPAPGLAYEPVLESFCAQNDDINTRFGCEYPKRLCCSDPNLTAHWPDELLRVLQAAAAAARKEQEESEELRGQAGEDDSSSRAHSSLTESLL